MNDDKCELLAIEAMIIGINDNIPMKPLKQHETLTTHIDCCGLILTLLPFKFYTQPTNPLHVH